MPGFRISGTGFGIGVWDAELGFGVWDFGPGVSPSFSVCGFRVWASPPKASPFVPSFEICFTLLLLMI